MIWVNEHLAGIIPTFLSEWDERPMREQLHTAYAHGGGVQPFKGFEITIDTNNPMKSYLQYPGDPVYRAIAAAKLRDEVLVLFQYAWVAIVSPGEETIVCRMD